MTMITLKTSINVCDECKPDYKEANCFEGLFYHCGFAEMGFDEVETESEPGAYCFCCGEPTMSDLPNTHDQSIVGLEAAYLAVYNRTLSIRVSELVVQYGIDKVDSVCTELNENNSVPCHWKVSELSKHYLDS